MKKFYIFVFFLICISLFILYSYGFIITHFLQIGSNFILSINSGDTLNTILKNLRENGLKGNIFIIKLYTRLLFKDLVIKIGDYEIKEFATYWEIIHDIDRGIGIPLKLTIPPGLKISEIALLYEKNGIISSKDFYKIINQQDFLVSYSLFNNDNTSSYDEINEYWKKFKIQINEKKYEGFFYPETYKFARGVDPVSIIKEPIRQFFKILEKFPIINLSAGEIYKRIIIASLIEEEAMLDKEKPIIASVIYNRLSKGMRLELCPTVEYVLPYHKKKLTLDDLNIQSPYNTYTHSGLPPTPICNPSFESLKAAFFPANTDYLFYVAKGDGSHYFSRTYSEHLRYKNSSSFY